MNIALIAKPVLPVVLILFGGVLAFAQEAEFFVEAATVDAGGEVRVNVRGNNIGDLVGLQYSLAWDKEVLEYEGIENIAFDKDMGESFNLSRLDTGRIGFLLVDPEQDGFNLPDSSLMFTFVFTASTSVGVQTTITWVEDPLEAVVLDNDGQTVTTTYTEGTVTVMGPNSLRNVAEDSRLTAWPNPVVGAATVRLQLNYATAATLELLDPSGRIVDRRNADVVAGTVEINLPASAFGSDGTYILRLTTDRERIHRKIVRHATGR